MLFFISTVEFTSEPGSSGLYILAPGHHFGLPLIAGCLVYWYRGLYFNSFQCERGNR